MVNKSVLDTREGIVLADTGRYSHNYNLVYPTRSGLLRHSSFADLVLEKPLNSYSIFCRHTVLIGSFVVVFWLQMFLLSRLAIPYSVRTSLFQFQNFQPTCKRMETIKSVLTSVTGGGQDSSAASGAANELIRHQLCQVNELQNGQMKEFEVKTPLVNASVLLIKQDNKFHAYSSKCCHYKLPLAKGTEEALTFPSYTNVHLGVLVNNRLRCFAHGACFRVDTGDIEEHPGHGHLPSRCSCSSRPAQSDLVLHW